MENKSGMMPVQDKVLLLPDDVSEKAGDFIFKPDIAREQERLAQTVATLIAAGPNAFEDWDDPKPKPGDRVYVTKYAGILGIEGEDEQLYQIICDRDITCIVSEKFRNKKIEGMRKPLGKQE